MALGTLAPTYPHLVGNHHRGIRTSTRCGSLRIDCSLNRHKKQQQQQEREERRVYTTSAPIHSLEDMAAKLGHDIKISFLERLFEIPPSPPATPSPRTPPRVAYQGGPGSYCHEAVSTMFPTAGSSGTTLPCFQMEHAFALLESDSADRAVIPIENSVDGPIPRNLDLLLRHPDVSIAGELLLPVNHCLLSAGTDSISTVLSHPQVLSHCRGRLDKLGFSVEEVPCAAEAARLLAEGELPENTAVIASRAAAREFGLRILEENIQDPELAGNVTRFLQLTLGQPVPEKRPAGGRKRVKATVAFGLENGTTDLFRAIWILETRGIDVIRVDHRPNRSRPFRVASADSGVLFDYVFVLDVEGDENKVLAATKALGEISTGGSARLLGSYAMPAP